MLDTVLGIPLHPLVVHAVVVLAPLTALLLVLFAVSARFRAWSGLLTPVVATLTLVLSPIATQSGETLQERVPESNLVHEHAEIGDTLPWVLLLATAAAWLMWWFWRREAAQLPPAAGSTGGPAAGATDGGTRGGASTLFRVLAVAGVLVAVGLAVDVTLVGHSGAQAVWSQVGSQPAPAGEGGEDG
ncbi:MAG TPA: DUF2231 domain-containing protein [Phycicoccus sp.]|nr:DUF2231 domain-containing protein [Phycicoccus sp.]